jgi:TatD DNase family protein
MYDTHFHLPQAVSLFSETFLHESLPDYPLLSVSTTPADCLQNLIFRRTTPNLRIAFGLHPWFIQEDYASQLKAVQPLLEQKPSAIGEIGLDLFRKDTISIRHQQVVLEQQLDWAEEYKLPVSIHAVRCHHLLPSILKNHSGVKGVIHGFNSSVQVAKHYVSLGYKLGIGPQCLSPQNHKLHDVITRLDIEDFVLETDFPNTMKLGVNRLEDIALVVQCVAQLKNEDFDKIAFTTTQTAKGLFQ